MSTPVTTTADSVRTCPRCAARLDADPRFTVWCPRCEWNLAPEPEAEPTEKSGAARTRAVRREQAAADRAEQLYRELAAGRGTATGRRDWLAAAAVAAVVHLATAALFGWALWLLVTGNTPLRCLGAAALAVVVLLRPRLGRVPRDEHLLDRRRAPALYGLADRIAAQLGTGPVGVIRIDGSFNASIGVVGLRRRTVLTLGLPLWEALDEQQRIALLGHEFAHRVNADHRRGLWLSSAIGALAHWHDLARPREHPGQPGGLRLLFQFAELISGAVLHGLAWLFWRALLLLDRLTARAGQQAEYHADTLAARTASTEAARGMLETLLLGGAVGTLVTRLRADHQNRPRAGRRGMTARAGAARAGAAHAEATRDLAPASDALWERLRDHLAAVPPLERERLRRRSALDRCAVDATHPPTHLRLALLERSTPVPAAITATPAEFTAITAELAPHRERVARVLLAG
ncbi:M48 family metalloprotease [Kitasatospora sp. NPDC092286]|uniref:M48 family metalloprotease n=1 Tax=Kitasatospora sp. NPDC092286 TaxID=3364087 RepID=UPI003824BA5A